MDWTTTTHSPEQTIEVGQRIGVALRGGEVLAISGPLGSGKTHLIKGIAVGAGADDTAIVHSPTFVLINQYEGRFEVYHIDAYRLDSLAEFEALGFDDLCHAGSIVLIEWADKVAPALVNVDRVDIALAHVGPTERQITIGSLPSYLQL